VRGGASLSPLPLLSPSVQTHPLLPFRSQVLGRSFPVDMFFKNKPCIDYSTLPITLLLLFTPSPPPAPFLLLYLGAGPFLPSRRILYARAVHGVLYPSYYSTQPASLSPPTTFPRLFIPPPRSTPVIDSQVLGRSFPVDVFFTREPCTDYLDACVTTVMQVKTKFNIGKLYYKARPNQEKPRTCR
jgi:hypothetical protein